MPHFRRSESTTAAADPATDLGVRFSWTKDRFGFHAVLKEVGTDRWLTQCGHRHPTVREAVRCGRRVLGL